MSIFWTRFSAFSLLWIYEMMANSTFLPISILFFAIGLGIYFLLSISHLLIWKYSLLILLIAVHGYFFSEESSMTMLLLLFILMDACFRIGQKQLLLLFGEVSIVLVILHIPNDLTIEHIIICVFIGFLSFKVNHMVTERNEQQEIYEELLGEYRMLKRLHLATEDNARLEERTRIARDIHDSVGHRLTALIMKLEMLHIQEGNPAFKELKHLAKESLEDTRSAVKTLQTDETEGIATVVHLIRKLEAESHLLVQFTLKQGVLSVPVTNEMSVVLYRVIQEALTNIMRHGETREAKIVLSKSGADDIIFEISNPIQKRKDFTFGFGLKNMQERVEEINGSLHVYQTKDDFIVSGKIPKGESEHVADSTS